MDKGAAKQRNEEAISPGRFKSQYAEARIAARGKIFPHTHADQAADYSEPEQGRRAGPCHP